MGLGRKRREIRVASGAASSVRDPSAATKRSLNAAPAEKASQSVAAGSRLRLSSRPDRGNGAARPRLSHCRTTTTGKTRRSGGSPVSVLTLICPRGEGHQRQRTCKHPEQATVCVACGVCVLEWSNFAGARPPETSSGIGAAQSTDNKAVGRRGRHE